MRFAESRRASPAALQLLALQLAAVAVGRAQRLLDLVAQQVLALAVEQARGRDVLRLLRHAQAVLQAREADRDHGLVEPVARGDHPAQVEIQRFPAVEVGALGDLHHHLAAERVQGLHAALEVLHGEPPERFPALRGQEVLGRRRGGHVDVAGVRVLGRRLLLLRHARGAFHALIGGLLPLLLTAVLRQRLTGAEARHEEQGQQQGRERTPKGGATHDFSFREPLPDAPRVISPLNRINRNPRPMRM